MPKAPVNNNHVQVDRRAWVERTGTRTDMSRTEIEIAGRETGKARGLIRGDLADPAGQETGQIGGCGGQQAAHPR